MDSVEREKGCKPLIANALEYGQAHWSEQTEFVHYYPHSGEDEPHDSIPIVENVLYALALMRSKTLDRMLEGQQLLQRLLAFQVKSGLFPIFLHQYPTCHDALIGRRLIPAFHLILRDFGHVLEPALLSSLKNAVKALAEVSESSLKEINAPAHVSIPLATALYLLGGEPRALVTDGLLQAWSSISQDLLCESQYLAELALALTWKEGPDWTDSMEEVWSIFCASYDEKRQVYTGPCAYELHYDDSPLRGLYGLLQAYIHGDLPPSYRQPGGYQLLAALFDRSPVPASSASLRSGKVGGNKWLARCTPHYSYSLLERVQTPPEPKHPGYHLARLHWESYSLSIQTDRQYPVTFEEREGGFRINISIDDVPDEETRARTVPVGLYISTSASPRILVTGKPSTVFELGTDVEIEVSKMRFALRCSSTDEGARFLGHVQRGNRPAQKHRTGKARFEAFDTCLLVRTVYKEGPATLTLDLDVLTGDEGE